MLLRPVEYARPSSVEEALELLERAAGDPDFGGWVRENAAREPLLDPVRDEPRFPPPPA